MRALDVDAVQAFVLAADLRSFTRAAEALDTTQSAVSLRIKRLEEALGRRLLERTPRSVRLSAEGSLFVGPARALIAAHQGALGSFGVEQRRLIVGISHHVVGAELPILIRRVNQGDPGLVMELHIASSSEVLVDLDAGRLDAAIVLRHGHRRRGGELILEEAFGWMAAPDFDRAPGQPLRLAAQSAPCGVRNTAIDALDRAGVPWTEVFVGGGIITIGTAVSAGLAVAALGRRVAPTGSVDVGPRLDLPVLPAQQVMLYSSLTDRRARASLKTLAAAIRSTVD